MSDQDMDEPGREIAEQDIVTPGDALTAESDHCLFEDDIVRMATNLPVYAQAKMRYLRLYYLMKSVVSIASKGVEASKLLLAEMTRMRSALLEIPHQEPEMPPEFREDESDGEELDGDVGEEGGNEHEENAPTDPDGEPKRVDVQDVVGRRRGRKKKSVREPYRPPKGSDVCFLCGKRHTFNRCPAYREYVAAREHNGELPEDSRRRRCRVCLGYGHNAKTCTWLWQNKKK